MTFQRSEGRRPRYCADSIQLRLAHELSTGEGTLAQHAAVAMGKPSESQRKMLIYQKKENLMRHDGNNVGKWDLMGYD